MAQRRGSAPLLPAVLLGAALCALATRFAARCFSSATPAGQGRLGRTAMRGFKDDFDAWRASLTPEERDLVQTQAANEFNKKFRKSDEFKKDLPEEKQKSFSKILQKFFDSEAADYKKELEAKVPNYNALLEKAGDKVVDFSLRHRVVEVDRDADRRYRFATLKNQQADARGEKFPQSSPMLEIWAVQNNDTKSHDNALKVIEFLKSAVALPSCPEHSKAMIQDVIAKGVPPMGQKFELMIPQQLTNQVMWMQKRINDDMLPQLKDNTTEEIKKFKEETLPRIRAETIKFLTDNYVKARDEVEAEAQQMKNIYRSQKDMPGKTKADILKEIWAELPRVTNKPVPPLDDEMLAELAQEPAIVPGEFRHSWGTADKLYKSEAIDAFGMKYLLGVFETKAEAKKAFDDWNAEYEKARADMKLEMAQWSKQENARLDKDTTGRERIKKVLEESRR